MVTIGVELEVALPENRAARSLMERQTGYHGEFRQAPGFPDGWCAQRDSSIHTERDDDIWTAEWVSPVLDWPSGLRSVVETVERLKVMDARTNPSTGLHVHVGGFFPDVQTITRLKALARRYEFALYGSAGAFIISRMADEHGRGYCKPSTMGVTTSDRYQGLNLTGLVRDQERRTVEFRMFQGSINLNRVLGPIGMAVALVLTAMNGRILVGEDRITSPVAAMQEFLTYPWRASMPENLVMRDHVERTLLRQARKAERMLGVT